MTLVERLRDQSLEIPEWNTLSEAADRIEELERQLNGTERLVDWYQAEHVEQVRRIEVLEAALRRIDGMNDHPAWFRSDLNDILMAALKDKTV